jgi:hypothetical protein
MPSFQFRFDGNTFRNAFAPRKPRHPLLRIAIALLGLCVVLTLVFVSVFVGVAMLAAGVLVRLLRMRGQPVARDHRVVDGQYRVIAKPALPRA